jgi:hypothetical protein
MRTSKPAARAAIQATSLRRPVNSHHSPSACRHRVASMKTLPSSCSRSVYTMRPGSSAAIERVCSRSRKAGAPPAAISHRLMNEKSNNPRVRRVARCSFIETA